MLRLCAKVDIVAGSPAATGAYCSTTTKAVRRLHPFWIASRVCRVFHRLAARDDSCGPGRSRRRIGGCATELRSGHGKSNRQITLNKKHVFGMDADTGANMTRRKLTTLIVAGALSVAVLGVAFIKSNESAAPPVPTAEQSQGAQRPKDVAPAQIEQAPRRREDVFVPPPSDVTGTATLPPPK